MHSAHKGTAATKTRPLSKRPIGLCRRPRTSDARNQSESSESSTTVRSRHDNGCILSLSRLSLADTLLIPEHRRHTKTRSGSDVTVSESKSTKTLIFHCTNEEIDREKFAESKKTILYLRSRRLLFDDRKVTHITKQTNNTKPYHQIDF